MYKDKITIGKKKEHILEVLEIIRGLVESEAESKAEISITPLQRELRNAYGDLIAYSAPHGQEIHLFIKTATEPRTEEKDPVRKCPACKTHQVSEEVFQKFQELGIGYCPRCNLVTDIKRWSQKKVPGSILTKEERDEILKDDSSKEKEIEEMIITLTIRNQGILQEYGDIDEALIEDDFLNDPKPWIELSSIEIVKIS